MSGPGLAPALRAAFRLLERSVALAPIVGVLLALPAIGSERVLDDHVLELVARESSEVVAPGSGLDLFRFASGDAGDNLALMAQGSMLPWYSDPELKITFFRPLSSLLHRLDYFAWPHHSELMYVHSLAWLGALLLLVWRLYRRLELEPSVAALAAWLYAVNDANGTVVAWLSNRNALMSAVGAVAALLAHHRARREGHAASRFLAPLWLAFGLFAGELGASAWAYLLAYALVFETGPLLERLRSLAALLLTTLGWAVCYLASGAGTRASGVYLHPLGDLPAFAAELPGRALVLLGAAFGPFPAELSFLGPLPLVPLWPVAAALVLCGFGWLIRAQLARDPIARFWAIGVALGVVPVAASFPSDRLLLLVNLGAMALVARLLLPLLASVAPGERAARAYGWALLAVHALLAPVLLPLRARQIQALGRATEHAFACLDAIDDLEHKTLVVLGAPADFFVGYVQAERAARSLPRPEHVYWVANPEAALDLRVTGERTLSTERQGGFFVTPSEALYRRASAPLAVNASVGLPELTARISGLTSEGRPSRVEFRFDEPLSDARFVFLALRNGRYERVLPAELDRLRRVSPIKEAPNAQCPIGTGSTCPSPAQRGRGEPGTNMSMNLASSVGLRPSAPPPSPPSALRATSPVCAVCGAGGRRAVAEVGDVSCNVRAYSSEHFRLWRCADCNSIHAQDEVDLAHYYTGYPFFDLPMDWRLRVAYREQLRRLEAAGLRHRHRVLDYGCGAGAFLRYLRECGYANVTGYDGYSPRFADDAVLRDRYDCVLSQDVLEHVAEPQSLLDRFHHLAKPGGLIAIGTPNASAIDLSRAEDYRHALHAPYHRHIFSKQALLAAGTERRWSLVQYYPTQYANTAVPFLNSRFYLFFMRTLDDTLDCLIEQPPRIGPCLARLPSAMFWGMCGSYRAEETDVMAIFRRR